MPLSRSLRNLVGASVLALSAGHAAAAELQLMMVEQTGCHWCAEWNARIAPIYPKTDEGRSAPLLRHMLRDPLPEGVTLVSPPQFTPTFILLRDGTEVGRIPGYPGEDFFWGLLSGMIAKASATDLPDDP